MSHATKKSLCSVALFAAAVASPAWAQAGEFQNWTGVLGQVDIGESPWVFAYDAHGRRFSGATGVLVRPGIGYKFAKGWTGYLGYAWTPVFSDDSPAQHEHRVWQQVIGSGSFGSAGRWAVRPRFEQRASTQDEGIAYRIRLFLRGSYAVRPNLWLVAWDELFVGLNDVAWGPQTGYDQNRLFLGVAFPQTIGPRFEIGYLLVNLERDNNDTNHALAVNAFF